MVRKADCNDVVREYAQEAGVVLNNRARSGLNRQAPGRLLTLAFVLIAPAAFAQLPNGGFESGDLSNWTAGGGGAVEALQAAGFTPAITPPEGSWFALLSDGPGDVAGAPGGNFDSNGTNDFDSSTLSTTFTTVASGENLSFRWAFITSEVGESGTFDDLFEVTLDGISVLSGSVNHPGGVSPFPDTPAYDGTAYTVNGAGPTAGSSFGSGVSPFRSFCLEIADPGTYTLQFLIADQGDAVFDTGLLVDEVRVPSACNSSITQITDSAGADLEVKGGGLFFTPVLNRRPATSQNGAVLAFVSNANLTGDNPNAIDQIFVAAPGGFERITAMTGGHVGNPALTSGGRFVTFESAGDLTPGSPGNADGNIEVFRWDRSTSTMTQVTDTTGCENRNPTISHNNQGRRIALSTDCTDLAPGFNADGNLEVVIWDANSGNFQFNETAGCNSAEPAIARHNQGRFVSFRSDCDYSGGNADGNNEIFQWNRQSNNYHQITASAGAFNEVASSSNNGRYVAFLSDADYTGGNADGSLEVFRFDRNGGGSFLQLTDESVLVLHTFANIENSGRFIAFERINVLLGTSEVLHVDANTATLTPVVLQATSISGLFPVTALVSGNPLVAFGSATDLAGNNADTNDEIFQAGAAFAVPVVGIQCSNPGLAIPDNTPAGVTDTLTAGATGTLLDLNVSVDATHSFAGDLVFTLVHQDTGTSVTLIDRPGSPPGAGCSGDDLDVTLDDEAALAVENQCVTPGPIAIDGTFTPGGVLAGFDTEDLAGNWDLTVADLAAGDTGTLVEWCLISTTQP